MTNVADVALDAALALQVIGRLADALSLLMDTLLFPTARQVANPEALTEKMPGGVTCHTPDAVISRGAVDPIVSLA